jgi:hypothetical protein
MYKAHHFYFKDQIADGCETPFEDTQEWLDLHLVEEMII